MKGIGVDVGSVSIFKEQVQSRDLPFVNSSFTANEVEYSFGAVSERPEQHLAVRYAAKEAVIKALDQARGELFQPIASVNYKHIEVLLDCAGRPYIELKSELKVYADDLGIRDIKVSLSHDNDYAIAQVYIA